MAESGATVARAAAAAATATATAEATGAEATSLTHIQERPPTHDASGAVAQPPPPGHEDVTPPHTLTFQAPCQIHRGARQSRAPS